MSTNQGDYGSLAIEAVSAANPDGHNFCARNIYSNIMGGDLVDVGFQSNGGAWATNHVLIGKDKEVKLPYRSFHDVCTAIADYREPNPFFRLINFAGTAGLIALFLITIFSLLLCAMALWGTKADAAIVEIIKMSFAIILGYFFGSQSSRR